MAEVASGDHTCKQSSLDLLVAVPLAVLAFYALSKSRSRWGRRQSDEAEWTQLASTYRAKGDSLSYIPSLHHLDILTWDRRAPEPLCFTARLAYLVCNILVPKKPVLYFSPPTCPTSGAHPFLLLWASDIPWGDLLTVSWLEEGMWRVYFWSDRWHGTAVQIPTSQGPWAHHNS